MWCSEHPTRMVGPTSDPPSRRATSTARRSPRAASTRSGRCGPCCSIAPTAITMDVKPPSSAFSTSGQVISSRSRFCSIMSAFHTLGWSSAAFLRTSAPGTYDGRIDPSRRWHAGLLRGPLLAPPACLGVQLEAKLSLTLESGQRQQPRLPERRRSNTTVETCRGVTGTSCRLRGGVTVHGFKWL